MTFTAITGLLNTCTSFTLGLFVFLKNPRNKKNQSYLYFGLSVALYSLGYFMWARAQTSKEAVLAFQVLVSGIILINSAYLEFVFSLLGKLREKRRILLLCHALNLTFLILNVRLFLYQEVMRKSVWGYWPIVQMPFYIYFGFWLWQVGYGLFYLWRSSRRVVGKRGTQIKYVFASTLIGYFGGGTNWLPWFDINLPPHLNILVTAYVGILAYAIVRHQLLEIEVIIKKTLVFAGLFGVVMAVVSVATALTQTYFNRYFTISPTVSMALTAFLVILLYDPTRKLLVNMTDRYLFQKKEDIKVTLKRLSESIITMLDIDLVGKKILSTLQETLRLESGAIILKDENEKNYRVLDAFGVAAKDLEFEKDEFFIRYLSEMPRMVNLEDPAEKINLPIGITGKLIDLKAVICIPLFLHADLIGILALGKKKSDEEFTVEELEYLPTVATQAAIALSNARLYDILKKSQIDFAQQAKMAAIGTLSAGISHEIKNPLNHMRLAIGMLRMNRKLGVYKTLPQDQLEEEIFSALDSIDSNITRATEVIERLSSFAKKPKELKIEAVNLEMAMEHALRFMTREFEHYGINVERKYGRGVPDVFADLHAIEDVLLNILVNARHAIKDRGVIEVSTCHYGEEVEVCVKDTGAGISPQHLEKIFDPFFTTKDTSRNTDEKAIKGTGLGLFIVRELIKKFGGRIAVESEVGKGTAFRIFFLAPGKESNLHA